MLKQASFKVFIGVCVLIAAWLSVVPASNAAEDEAGSVLLVGNSFTGAMLPHLTPFRASARWLGGWNLDQHFNDAISRATICGNHKFVVIQDFSTRAQDNALFQQDIDEMVPLVRSCNAVPVLFMTWETDFISFQPVKFSHEQAANKHGIQIIAIGAVWHEVRQASEVMYRSLLKEDGKHPSLRGNRVAAASMLKAFCESCYQSFNWYGFTPNEQSLLKSIIATKIVKITVPDKKPNYLPAIIELLL